MKQVIVVGGSDGVVVRTAFFKTTTSSVSSSMSRGNCSMIKMCEKTKLSVLPQRQYHDQICWAVDQALSTILGPCSSKTKTIASQARTSMWDMLGVFFGEDQVQYIISWQFQRMSCMCQHTLCRENGIRSSYHGAGSFGTRKQCCTSSSRYVTVLVSPSFNILSRLSSAASK